MSFGATELREVLFRLAGAVGVISFWEGALIRYSSRFHLKNSLIFPNVVLFEGEFMIYDRQILIAKHFRLVLLGTQGVVRKFVVNQLVK